MNQWQWEWYRHYNSGGGAPSYFDRPLVHLISAHPPLPPPVYSGYLQLLEIYWNLKTLLEISLSLCGPPGDFCVKCWWSTALVFSHDKNWVLDRLFKKLVILFLSLPHPHVGHIMFCSIFRQISRFGTLHSRPKQCKHVLDFSWNPSWNLEICSVKFVHTVVQWF